MICYTFTNCKALLILENAFKIAIASFYLFLSIKFNSMLTLTVNFKIK